MCSEICKSCTCFVRHGVRYSEQCVRKSHSRKALRVVHRISFLHVSLIRTDKVVLYHSDGENSEWICVVAMGCRNVGLNRVSKSVHSRVCGELFRHCFGKLGVYYRDVGRYFEIGDRIFDTFLIICYYRKSRDLRCGSRCRRNCAESRFSA